MTLTPVTILAGIAIILALLSYYPGAPTLGLAVICVGIALLIP